jgi:hypothetical protein
VMALRATVLAAVLAAMLAGPAAAAAPTGVRVTIVGPNHAPRVVTKWQYAVHVTSGGKPVAARLTERIVDPLGGTHAVQYGPTKKDIVAWPINGTFRDYIIWPADSRGIPLKLRAIVTVGGAKHVAEFTVTPRG